MSGRRYGSHKNVLKDIVEKNALFRPQGIVKTVYFLAAKIQLKRCTFVTAECHDIVWNSAFCDCKTLLMCQCCKYMPDITTFQRKLHQKDGTSSSFVEFWELYRYSTFGFHVLSQLLCDCSAVKSAATCPLSRVLLFCGSVLLPFACKSMSPKC